MYLEYFGLLESPFSIAPDPRYLYMSERHREALAHLLYGMDSDGAFILLTGDVGTGKTTVSRCLLEQVPEDTNLALVLNPKLNSIELLQVICDELRIEYDKTDFSVKSLVDRLNRYLLGAHAQGKKTVVLIEEAQNLDLDVLEQLRLLTNLETNERKLLQVILLGQPEFLDVLDRPELSQLAQRITARFHLTPLSSKEVEEYISHRLAVAGCRRPLLAQGVMKQLYNYSGGVPRLINVICDRALLGCYVQNRSQVEKPTLAKAAKEVLGENKAAAIKSSQSSMFHVSRVWKILLVIFAGLILVGAVAYLMNFKLEQLSVVTQVENPLLVNEEKNNLVAVKDVDSDVIASKDSDARNDVGLSAENNADLQTSTEEPVQSYIQWPDGNQRLRSNLQAYQSLFKSWQLDFQVTTDGTPCFYANTQGLSCLHELSDLDSLRKLNRPAVLKLYDDFNQPQYVALLELAADTAKIHLADKIQTVSLEQLLFYWKGEFSILWRIPPGYQDLIKPGDSGEAVVWLSKSLNQINNVPSGLERSIYSTELVRQVKEFQLRENLLSDGVVGVNTLVRINQLIGLSSPVLETR